MVRAHTDTHGEQRGADVGRVAEGTGVAVALGGNADERTMSRKGDEGIVLRL